MGIHLGIIPDGNRRYCKKNGMSLLEMVENCFETHFLDTLDYIYRLTYSNRMEDRKIFDINELSFYMLSADNLKKRDQTDIKGVLLFFNKVYDYFIKCIGPADLDERTKNHALLLNKINIQFIGEFTLLPQDIVQKINTIHKKFNKTEKNFKITIAIAYDPIKDLKDICRDEASLKVTTPENSRGRGELHSPQRYQSPIDVIIRTSGEKRLSGFFPYHSLYSELVFVKKLWPEFRLDDLENALAIFNSRDRRFGI